MLPCSQRPQRRELSASTPWEQPDCPERLLRGYGGLLRRPVMVDGSRDLRRLCTFGSLPRYIGQWGHGGGGTSVVRLYLYLGRELEESEGASGREAPTAHVGRKKPLLPPCGRCDGLLEPCRSGHLGWSSWMVHRTPSSLFDGKRTRYAPSGAGMGLQLLYGRACSQDGWLGSRPA